MSKAHLAPQWRNAVIAAALVAAAGAATAADVNVSIDTRNSGTNPGPFSAGSNTTFALDFRIDGSVTPTGAVTTWAAAADDMVLQINDATLGSFTITGQDGRWQQMSSTGDFLFGGWGGGNGGTLSAFSVVNPALSATPFVLTSISFDLRGSALLADESTLPGALTLSDFSFLSLTLQFSNADPATTIINKWTIIRGAAFDDVTVSPVPEPASSALLLAGLAGLGAWARRRRQRGAVGAATPA